MTAYKTILVIDSALRGFSIAVIAPHLDVPLMVQTEMERGQAEHLVPAINDLMNKAGLAFSDLEALLVTRGPGAFAGLRIGLSTARAMAVSLGIPLFGMSTFDALVLTFRSQSSAQEGFCVVLETKRQDFYAQFYNDQYEPLSEGAALSKERLGIILKQHNINLIIGDAGTRTLEAFPYLHLNSCDLSLSNTAACAKAFAENTGQTIFELNPAPLYLRDADVSLPKTPYRTLENCKT